MTRLIFNKRNNIFDPIFNDNIIPDSKIPGIPTVSISETDSHYYIKLETKGLRKRDLMIRLDRKLLKISVEKSEEIGNVQFFALPDSVDDSNIKTRFTKGVLKFNVAKTKRKNSGQAKKHK
ncbi:Hsp20/alpha crystallin family protein [Pedobacter nyackensis]|nr:Hsp20/alpha crystallin family protein [Pedobacter nyackensis]